MGALSSSSYVTDNAELEKLKILIEDPSVTLKAILGMAYECCCDQALSRWIQARLGQNDPHSSDLIEELCNDEQELLELGQHADDSLMRDVFANFVIQKILFYARPAQLEMLFKTILK